MSSTNRFTISKVPSYEQVIKEKHSSEVLVGSVSFDEEDDDLSRKPKHPSKTTHSDPIPEPIKSHEIPLLPSKTPPQNEIHDGSLLSNTLVPESSKDDQERTSPLGMNCIKGLISMDFEIGEVELPIDTIQDGPKTPMSAASTSSKGPDISSDQSELKEEKIHPASEISSDVLIEEIYDAELNVDATKSDVSEEGTLFTVLTPSPKPDKSADSINGSLSSSTAELVQLIDSEEMEFDASEFKASSTPEDGRSLIMMNMKKGRGESAQGQSSDEELRSYMLSPPPSKLRMSSDKTFSRTSKRPSILKQKFSFPDFIRDPDEESQASARTNSKVTFHDKIQTTYFPQSNGGTQAKQSGSDCHDTWMNNNTEEHVSLELPRFTQNRPVHLTDMAEETSSWSDARVPTLWEEPDLVTRSKPLSDTERKGKLHTSSLPAYLNTSEKKEYTSTKSTSAVTEKEVINFVKEIMNATRSVRDGAETEPFARYKGKAVTPSKLHQKVESREEAERASGRRDSVPSYTTPSKLLSSVWDEGHEEGPSNNGDSEEILLRVASTLISSLDSGIGSEVNSVPSLRKLLQDVEILEKKIPTVASAPVYSSASALLHKLLHRTKFKEKPSLTAAYLESLNCFEPVATDNSPHTSESDTSRSPSKPLNVNCPQSAPVVKLQHSDRPEAKIFLTDTILTKPAEQSDNHLSRYSIHEHWDRICSWLSLKEQDRMRYSSRRATKGSISSGYPDDSSIWSTENSQDTFILSPTEVSKQSYLDDDMQRSSGDVKERSKHRIPVAGSSPGSKSYVEGKQSSPPDESDATTQNQVLVNQAIVDMVNAVTLYEHQMSNKKSPKKKPKREEKKLSKGPSESSAEGTGQIKPPKPDPSSPPCPCQAITPYSPAQPQARSPCPDERSAGTDEIIREINDRLMKMKEADDNRYHDVVTQYYNQYSGTATGFGPKCVAISDRTKPDPSKLSVMISQYVHGKNLTEPHVGMDAKRGNGGAQGLDQIEHGAKLEMHDDKYEDPPVSLYYGHSPFRKQKTGASLPTSGAASPNRDKVLGGYTRKSSAGDVSKFLIEKEVMESQLRRLQVENSTLQTENKLLKEKYNRGQVRIAQLESQVRNTKQQALNMNEEISEKMSRYKRHARDRTEKDLFECQERVAELTRELESSKAEHATLQKQLTNSRRSADVLRSSNPSDRSRIIESFKVDIFSLKDEVKRAKQLLAESELSREQEAARRKETSAQIVKLTEMKVLLQQQLETTCGGSVAEKQIIRDERGMLEDRISRYKDTLEDVSKEKEELEVLLKGKVKELTQANHNAVARVQNLEDLHTAITAENDSLRASLRMTCGNVTPNPKLSTAEAQVEQLKGKVLTMEANLEQKVRTARLLDTELESTRNRLSSKEAALEEALSEMNRLQSGHMDGQDLLDHKQQQIDKLNAELDQLQSQVRQKIRSLERMASTESHHTAQLQALRENLTSANKELSEKTAQLRMLETENEHMKDRVSRKEFADTDSPFDGLGQSEVQRRMLDMERENAKRDLDRANTALNMIIKENTVLTSRVRELRQELVKERTQLCQITTDKVDIEQQLHLCCEERDTLQAERDRLKVDINKISSETNQSIYKLESDMNRSPTSDYESHYHSLTPEGKKIAVELGTVHRLLEAREKEAILLKDTIDRQKDELQSLNRKIELLHEENRSGRDNIDRLTNQLSLKIKEHASVSEANQSLASAKNQLQMEKLHLEKDVGQGGSEMERRLSELQELTRKLEKAEERFRDAERLLHQKDTSLVAMETELKHLNRNNNILESEKTHLKSQVDKINEELRSIRNTNTALEQRLSSEKSVVTEEKMSVRQLNQELTSTHRHVDSVKRDYEVALANLETERKNVQNLQTALQHAEDKMFELQDVVTNKEGEKDSLKNQLADYKNTVDQYKKDKQTLYQDVQELCRKLADKDDTITKVREKYNAAVDRLQKDFTAEKTNLTREKEKLELDLAKMKEEIEELTERLRRKDMQIEAYVRTNNDLDNERRVRHDCETQVLKLEADLKEARQTLDMLQMENKRKADENKHSQDVVEKSQTQLSQLKETYKTQREQLTREIHELRQTLSEDAHKHEVEKNQLKEHIATATAKLQSTEVSLASVTEYKATLHEDSKGLEKSVEALRGQLHEEITARKLAEQKYETYKYQAEDVRAKKSALDERNVELQAAYAKIEVELNVEKDKYNRLKQEVSDERSTSSNVEAHAQSLHIQVNELQAEVSSLRSQLESQKQNLQGKNKRLTLDMKQQTENFDKERSKLVMQIQQGSTDLESAREQVAIKNREHLKLQEEILSLEERYREASSSLKHVKESLRIEEQHREKLEFRNQELELRMKTRSEDDSDASRLDATRAEISKTMAEMKKKMELQLEQSKLSEKEMAAKHQQLIEEHKRKIANLDSALGQEQAMHLITKTQLSSVEEDNQRLRTQLQLARKRTSAPEERTKSRMEEINEIIARSQTRAQQMLATGAYSDDPLRSGGREMILSPIPMMHNISLISDGNKSMGSDDISKNN